MRPIHLRFNDTLIAALARSREDREQFQRLLKDRPTGMRVKTRAKNPQADLSRFYRRDMLLSTAGAVALLGVLAVGLPDLEIQPTQARADQMIIAMEDIPETRQLERPPPPPRPAVPIETESEDVPDDVTIESTDLDIEEFSMDVPPPLPPSDLAAQTEEEEILEVWMVEEKPKLLEQVSPEYPMEAREAGLQGAVFVKLLVGPDGKVRGAQVVKGEKVFRDAAVRAALQFVFRPAVQNDKPVSVWVMIPMQFRLSNS